MQQVSLKKKTKKELVNFIIIILLVMTTFSVIFIEDVKAISVEDPYQSNESPNNGSSNVSILPILNVTCYDNDTADLMNATWWSNSTDGVTWVQFGSNETSFSTNTFITQINQNFTSPGTTYWWSVNLTDGYDNWSNETYFFTTNFVPYQTAEYPPSGSNRIAPTPSLYVTCNDNDSDVLTAYWYGNSTGSWALFGTNSSFNSSKNITQTNSNFSSSGTKYYWRVNLTDGNNNWYNMTYNFTTNYDSVLSSEEPNDRNTSEPLNVRLNITITDVDGDTMDAAWFSNSSGPWVLFDTNNSISSGDIISQINTNFSVENTKYWWSVNVTDGCNWTNATYSFTTKILYQPNAPTSLTATASSASSISLSWTKGNKADRTLIVRKTGSYPTSRSDGTNITWDTDTTDLDTGLSASTTYYYKAWSWNATGSEFSSFNVTASATTSSGGGGSSPPPYNYVPIADAGGPYSGVVNQQITFTGSGNDPDGKIAGYKWDFETDGKYDTKYSTTTTVTHSYSSAGEYTVTLMVKDNVGLTDIDTATVTISEGDTLQGPTADAGGSYIGLTFESILFDGSGSSDSDGTITNLTWNFGDGTIGYGINPTHSYNTAEEFTIILIVKDNDNLTNTAKTIANISLDSDGDGWSDEDEKSYNTNSDNPDDRPVDTDNDGIPDEGSEDGKYIGDIDDDNDGLDDLTEELLGSNPKESSDVDDMLIGVETSYLVDTDGDGIFNKYYNPITEITTETKCSDEGKYFIDTDEDAEWNFIYDPALGTVIEYEYVINYIVNKKDSIIGFGWLVTVSLVLIIIAVIIIIIVALFKTGYLYIEEDNTVQNTSTKEFKKENKIRNHRNK